MVTLENSLRLDMMFTGPTACNGVSIVGHCPGEAQVAADMAAPAVAALTSSGQGFEVPRFCLKMSIRPGSAGSQDVAQPDCPYSPCCVTNTPPEG